LNVEYKVVKEILNHNLVDETVKKHKSKNSKFTKKTPIVTIMGHVDHGKTTLLDYIRKSKLTDLEIGGITQTIGAYQTIDRKGNKITFIDTPGHEAFTAMRSQGAKVTDIAVIIVAADDSIMPQTKESIDHAKAAGIPIIVAINKIDAPGSNPSKVMNDLSAYGVISEEFGGDVPFVQISALKGTGVDTLLETISLISEISEFKADFSCKGYGTVLEAKLDKFLGPVVNIIVDNGYISQRDVVVCGSSFGKVRKLIGDNGKNVEEAEPATPVQLVGLDSLPKVGDVVFVVDDERFAKQIATDVKEFRKKESSIKTQKPLTLKSISERLANEEKKKLNIILKGDTQGRVEAIASKINSISNDEINVNLIRFDTGNITNGDITLAKASDSIIYMFGLKPTSAIIKQVESEGINLRTHDIIYKLIEEIEGIVTGMLEPVFKEVILGEAEIKKIFTFSKIGNIAGSYMREGKISNDSLVRILRDGKIVYEGNVSSLRQEKKDVKEVTKGKEFGFTMKDFNDIKEGDIAQLYKLEKE
ncbi:MAG: translation initiation factor IF-2, partial [Mycoplasmataceae bacterium]|nr:translation initiation factor IF-2 [Mycoplasmataceae bacterium]